MVDTARTLAAIKALLADNTVGAISAQDLRDVIESVVDPVPAGGFPGVGSRMQAFYTYSGIISQSLPAGTQAKLPLGANNPGYANNGDPEGWAENTYALLGSDPESTWGVDIVAGDALLLPPGMYMTQTFVYFTGTPPTYDRSPYTWVGAYLDQARFDPMATWAPVFPGWWYETYRSAIWAQESPPTIDSATFTSLVYWVSATHMNDTDTVQPYYLTLSSTANQPSTTTVERYYQSVMKIG